MIRVFAALLPSAAAREAGLSFRIAIIDGDDQIDLVLLVVVGDALTGDEEVVVEELVA